MATVRELNENDDARFGLVFPLEYHNQKGGFFPTSKTLKEQASSNLKNLLLTNKGERVGQPDFGAEITSILFEQVTPDLGDRIEASVRDAVSRWLPYINLVNVFTTLPENNPNLVLIQIEFTITIDDPNAVNTITFTFNRGE
jgi:phage baseplate assembly protein W